MKNYSEVENSRINMMIVILMFDVIDASFPPLISNSLES
jgi:hypothetical protein